MNTINPTTRAAQILLALFLVVCLITETFADSTRIIVRPKRTPEYLETAVYFEIDPRTGAAYKVRVHKSSGNLAWDIQALQIIQNQRHYPVMGPTGPAYGWRITYVNNGGR